MIVKLRLYQNKKEKLQNKFGGLFNKYNDFGKIKVYEVINKYYKKEDTESLVQKIPEAELDIHKEIIKKKLTFFKERSCKIYIFGFLFLTFYLIGIFQLLDLFDSTKKETGIIFKSFFYDEKRESNETFIELYINSCFKNVPEFDFAFFTSIIGSFPLNFCGFFISSLIFTFLNSFLFIIYIKIDLEKQKFDFFDFFHVSIYFLLFFISFGAISLFPHQKISEDILFYEKKRNYYNNYYDDIQDRKWLIEKKKENNINNNNNDEISNAQDGQKDSKSQKGQNDIEVLENKKDEIATETQKEKDIQNYLYQKNWLKRKKE